MVVTKEAETTNFERMYWEKARRNFKQGRKGSDPEKKLDEFLAERSTPQDARDLCKSTQKAAGEEYSPSLGGILEKIDIAMSVGDLAMKSAPESVGLVWMGIRLCLHSIADDFATFSIFGAACSDIIGIMISCAVFARMYGPSRGIESFQEIHAQVTDRIPMVYTEILDFSFSVKKYMNRNKLIRGAAGLFFQASSKYGSKIKSIKDHDLAMAEFARRAHEQLSDYYLRAGQVAQKEMLGSLTDIRSKLDQANQINLEYQSQVSVLVEELKKRKEMTPQDVALKNFDENMKALYAISDQETVYIAMLDRRSPPKTCTWIFDQAAFKSWFDSDKSDMLWVSGGGGFGKSILMAAVVNELQIRSADTGAVVQYFFCNSGDDATKKSDRILKNILAQIYQLVSRDPTETIEQANKLVSSYLKSKKGAKFGGNLSEAKKEDATFGEAFRGIAALLGKPAYIIVDALDECTDRSESLLASLQELMGEFSPHIKIIVCSRPEPDVERDLENTLTIKVEGNNGPDIRLNAETELAKLPGWTTTERETATSRIVEKAGSYFRYVDLAVGFLKQPWQRPLKQRLEQLPEGLPAFYEQIIRKTDPAYLDLLKTCLTWTILADGQVRVTELMDAYSRVYAVDGEDVVGSLSESLEDDDKNEVDAASDELYVSQIRTAGSALLEVDNATKVIQLRHNTVADHFLDAKPHPSSKNPSKDLPNRCEACNKAERSGDRFSITKKRGHLSIATTILKHLMNENFRQKHLVPFERTELKGTYEGWLDGFESDEETVDGQENEDNLIDTEINTDPRPSSSDAAQSAQEGNALASNSNGASQDYLALSSDMSMTVGIASVVDTSRDNNGGRPTEPVSDILSDVLSEVDSDGVMEDGEDEYRSTDADRAQYFRYEINHCAYHFRQVEELWAAGDRTGPEWMEFESLRNTFFQSDSPYFRSWVNLRMQVRNGELSSIDDLRTVHPIHTAAAYGLTSLAEKLIADGADTMVLTDEGYTPLDFAIEYYNGVKKDNDVLRYNNSIKLFEVLFAGGADANRIPVREERASFYRLFWYNPSLEVVQLFLKHGANPLQRHVFYKSTILHIFCLRGNKPEVLRELLGCGIDVEASDNVNGTALHWLMSRANASTAEVVRILLEAGANVDAEDDTSRRPLWELCADSGSAEAAKPLIEAGADIFDEDLSGMTALHIAAKNGHADLVKLLIDKGAKVDVTDNRGCTPVYKACEAKTDESALYMIEFAGDNINKSAFNGKTPLRKAAARGHRKIVEAIFEKSKFDLGLLTSKDTSGRTPLHAAAQHGRKEVVEYLLHQGAPATVEDVNGLTPLRACFDGWSEMKSKDYEAICLLLLDAEKESELDAGLLHIAAARGSLPVLNQLMDRGADPLAQDEHGWTSIQIAQHYHQEDAVELLSTRRSMAGFRPSELKDMLPKLLQLSGDKLEIKRTSKDTATERASTIAQHPIPAGSSGFYFEVEVDASSREDGQTDEPVVAMGLCEYPSKGVRGWLPGRPFPQNTAWAYHGDDGNAGSYPGKQFFTLGGYGHGDIVGCGLDVEQQAIFFTRNGKLLDSERLGGVTHYVMRSVRGRLYPVVGLATPGARVRANFGKAAKGWPFAWEAGNARDAGIGVVAERERELEVSRKVVRVRAAGVETVCGVDEGGEEGGGDDAGAEEKGGGGGGVHEAGRPTPSIVA